MEAIRYDYISLDNTNIKNITFIVIKCAVFMHHFDILSFIYKVLLNVGKPQFYYNDNS